MVESHAFIFADTISLDARAARKYRWCLYITYCPWIYGYLVPLRHAPLTLGLCLWEVVSRRCKRIPVIRSTAHNQPTYLSTSNHVRIFDITFSFVILYIPAPLTATRWNRPMTPTTPAEPRGTLLSSTMRLRYNNHLADPSWSNSPAIAQEIWFSGLNQNWKHTIPKIHLRKSSSMKI